MDRSAVTGAGLALLVLLLVMAAASFALAASMSVASARLGAYGGTCTLPEPPPPILLQPYTIPCY